MLSFFVVIVYSAIEIGSYALYRKVIFAFKLISNKKKSLSHGTRFRGRNDDLSPASQLSRLKKATILYRMCISKHSRAQANENRAQYDAQQDAQCNSEKSP